MPTIPTPNALLALRDLDSCAVANAIESLDPSLLRNTGFTRGGLTCMNPKLGPLVGYAVTARMRSSAPPPLGRAFVDRTEWWEHIRSLPSPRIVVIQDVDPLPGCGAFVGEVHSHILQALGCAGVITDGAVRDVGPTSQMGFQLIARKLSVSHAYAHLVAFGGPVEIDGLSISPGDVLHADQHGVLRVPGHLVEAIPPRAERLRQHERRIIELCRQDDFSAAELKRLLEATPADPHRTQP